MNPFLYREMIWVQKNIALTICDVLDAISDALTEGDISDIPVDCSPEARKVVIEYVKNTLGITVENKDENTFVLKIKGS